MARHMRAGWSMACKKRSVASLLLAFLLVAVLMRGGVLVAQGQVKTKGQTSAAVTLREGYPVEIMQLLDVLARIEARRQAKLRALRKDGE